MLGMPRHRDVNASMLKCRCSEMMEIINVLTGAKLLAFSGETLRLQLTTQAALHLQAEDQQMQGTGCSGSAVPQAALMPQHDCQALVGKLLHGKLKSSF